MNVIYIHICLHFNKFWKDTQDTNKSGWKGENEKERLEDFSLYIFLCCLRFWLRECIPSLKKLVKMPFKNET